MIKTARRTFQCFYVFQDSSKEVTTSLYNTTAYLAINKCKSGRIICTAENDVAKTSASHDLLVYDMNKAFGINPDATKCDSNGTLWVNEDDNVAVKCLASKNEYSNVTWILNEDKKLAGKTLQFSR